MESNGCEGVVRIRGEHASVLGLNSCAGIAVGMRPYHRFSVRMAMGVQLGRRVGRTDLERIIRLIFGHACREGLIVAVAIRIRAGGGWVEDRGSIRRFRKSDGRFARRTIFRATRRSARCSR